MQKLKGIIIFLLIIIIILLVVVELVNKKQDSFNNNIQNEIILNNDDNIELKEVTNPHMYLTVKECVEKYITYLYRKDNKSLYIIVDNEYINKFNINEENILNYLEKIETPVTLTINKMYIKDNDENIQEYYISGTIREESIENNLNKEKDFCVTAKLYIEEKIYSIVPYGYGGPLYEQE